MEVSDSQACYGLLGMRASLCSVIFTSIDMLNYVEFVLKEKRKQRQSNKGISDNDECLVTTEEYLDTNSMDSFIVQDADTDKVTNESSKQSDWDSNGEASSSCKWSNYEKTSDKIGSPTSGSVTTQIYID